MSENPNEPPKEVNEPDDDFTPRIPGIWHQMADGKIPIWLGMLIIRLTWIFLIIPTLILISPIWVPMLVVGWLRGKPMRLTEKEQAAVQRVWESERASRRRNP